MDIIGRLRTWWQEKTGEEETPFDGDAPAWVVSMVVHLVGLIALALITVFMSDEQITLLVTPPPFEEEEIIELPKEFYFNMEQQPEIGANSVNGLEAAEALAPEISEISEIPTDPVDPIEDGNIDIVETIAVATGPQFSENMMVRGATGVGTTGAVGAIDRITHEILLSLEERKTLVVWLFDQSGSLDRQRKEILDRFDRIYEELGVIEASGNEAFAKHDDKPLLTSVVAFGQEVKLMTKDPTDELPAIKQAVEAIETDSSGVEKVFSAVYMAVEKYKSYRLTDPLRNVMIVVVSDEVGDDAKGGLDETVRACRRYEVPVYCIGVPAPFGRDETYVKWVDPNPEYDQRPQWARVNQGPESFMPERLKLNFSASGDDPTIDSGFGPYALTRLCYETGGIYFTVHPNRNVNRAVDRRETAELAAHIEYFFDPQIMRKYRPDYVSAEEYGKRVSENKARAALVQASQMSWLSPMESPTLEFPKKDEADFANLLTEAQKEAAKLEPKIEALYQVLHLGEDDRPKEMVPRWQAGFDLAMGRLLAVKVRTESYNAMLAEAKRGLNFKDAKNDTWVLVPDSQITVDSRLDKMRQSAEEYLNRVVKDHPGTPWALLAQRELDDPIGWRWTEKYTGVTADRQGNGNGNGNPRDRMQMLQKPPARRPPPKL